ncbi:hypothetical protein ACFRAR_21825 [Kitasatospora sp. NPDC056651]|uniref:hypothetical protein n=1 Tax=Kitasatospora sp. NPDC056651 TaxID=3345892 RepID=UPI0036AFD09C
MAKTGLRVAVQGDLPAKTMERIADAVRRTVLDEVAELDLAPPLHEVSHEPGKPGDGLGGQPVLGIVFDRAT